MTRRIAHPQILRVLATLLALLAVGCDPAPPRPVAPPTPSPTATSPVVVGALLDVGSTIGRVQLQTMTAAVDLVNERGGVLVGQRERRPVRLVVYDTVGDAERTDTAHRALIQRDAALAVIGPTGRELIVGARRVAEELATPAIVLGDAAGTAGRSARWSFALGLRDEDALLAMMDFLRASGVERVGWLAPRTASAIDLRRTLSASGAGGGPRIVGDATVPPATEKLTAQLSQLQAAEPQVVVGWPRDAREAAAIAEDAATVPGLVPIFLGPAAVHPDMLVLAGDAATGVRTVTPRLAVADDLWDHDPLTPVIRDFRRELAQRTTAPATIDAALAWDAVRITIAAIETSSANRSALRDTIESMTDFPGVTGPISFSPFQHDGLDRRALIVARAAERRWRLPP